MGLFSNKSELRTHPSNPAKWLLQAFGGGLETTAGVQVNEEQALQLTTVFTCVKVLAESVGSLPLKLYKRAGNGNGTDKELAVGHPKYHLLHDAPNPEMTSMTFREAGMNHLNTHGNSYALKVVGKTGRIEELWPLRPERIDIARIDVNGRTTPMLAAGDLTNSLGRDNSSGELVYLYRKDSGGTEVFARREVLHIPGLGYNGIIGYSPIAKAREAIGLAFAQEAGGAKLLKNGLRPRG